MANHPNFQIPWGAIYKAAIGEDGRVRPAQPGTLLFGRSTSPWKLLSVMVSQTRFWACSSAQFTIVRPILTSEDKILKINTTDPDGRNYFDLRPEDPIIINLGYASSLFSDTATIKSNRVFFGYVDTIKVSANSRGIKIVVSCRDPMRFLIDNKFSGSIMQSVQTKEQKAASTSTNTLTPKAGFYNIGADSPYVKNLDPTEVQRALAGFDDDETINTESSRFFLDKNGTNKTFSITVGDLDKHKVMAWLVYAGSNGSCLPAPLVDNNTTFASNSETKLNKDPRIDEAGFEISTRPIVNPTVGLDIVSGFNVMNRFPLEVLKHLGALEAEPRELYADIDTGRICWKRKRIYKSDPAERKVYSFLLPAKNGTVPPNIIASEVDWSTSGTISEVVVINPQADTQGGTSVVNKTSGVLTVVGRLPDDTFFPDTIPAAFPGLKRFTRRTRFIFDDTITSADTTNAENLAEAFLRIWGKDIRAGTITIPGDSSLRPGHAVELHNTGIFDSSAATIGDPEFFRIEAVTHKMTAAGPNKGYRSLVAYAEADETREIMVENVYKEIGSLLVKSGTTETKTKVGRQQTLSKVHGNGGKPIQPPGTAIENAEKPEDNPS